MLYVLLMILIGIFMFVIIADKDIFSPAAIICESYMLAVICASLNIELWNISLSIKTLKIILIGVLSFVIPSLILLHTYIKDKKNDVEEEQMRFSLNKKIYIVFLILQVITLFLYLFYVVKTIGGTGPTFSISKILYIYRQETSYNGLESQIPTFVNQLVKVSQLIGYISLYYFMYNKIVLKNKNECKTMNILSMVLYILVSMLSGGRYKMISFFLAMIVMYLLLNYKVKRKNTNIKQVFKITFIIVAILFVFSQTRAIVGRTSEDSFVTYISSYFGGSIQSLNLYLDDSYVKSDIFGKETFYAINNTLSKFDIVEPYRMHLEFRTSNGVSTGNVYTALRCFYQDFGISGIVVMQALLAIIWTSWYKKLKKDRKIFEFDSSLLFYCMFINCLFFNSYRDNFFSSTLSVSTLSIIIYFIIVKKLLIKKVPIDINKKIIEGDKNETKKI